MYSKNLKYFVTILLLLIFAIVILSCSSENPIEDETKDIYWDKSDSPILIEGCYVVPKNTTLTIEAGTEIRFRTKSKKDFDYSEIKTGMLVIQGTILAEGTEQDSIIFTKDESVDNWGAIVFEEIADPNSILKYCKVEYTSEVEDYQYSIIGAITFLAFSKAKIINCNITNSYIGIQCNGYAEPIISDCTISDCTTGIYSNRCRSLINGCLINKHTTTGIFGYGSYSTIENCEIRDNGSSGIYVEYKSFPEIIYNKITNNGYSGIRCYEESSPNIVNNVIENNIEKGIFSNYHCHPNIVNNLVNNSIIGIHIANYSNPIVINNTVVNNGSAFRLYNDSSPDILNTIIWNNDEVFNKNELDYNCYPTLHSSLIQGDSLHTSFIDQGQNILGVDPMFINDSLDFNLQSSSPCIDKGFNDITELPETDLNGNPRIVGSSIDIGAYEFQGSK